MAFLKLILRILQFVFISYINPLIVFNPFRVGVPIFTFYPGFATGVIQIKALQASEDISRRNLF